MKNKASAVTGTAPSSPRDSSSQATVPLLVGTGCQKAISGESFPSLASFLVRRTGGFRVDSGVETGEVVAGPLKGHTGHVTVSGSYDLRSD